MSAAAGRLSNVQTLLQPQSRLSALGDREIGKAVYTKTQAVIWHAKTVHLSRHLYYDFHMSYVIQKAVRQSYL